jgi:hypothetical protein
MTKQELIQAAKEISEICRSILPSDCPMSSVKNETKCPFAVKLKNEYVCAFYVGAPEYWVFKGQERESNDS